MTIPTTCSYVAHIGTSIQYLSFVLGDSGREWISQPMGLIFVYHMILLPL